MAEGQQYVNMLIDILEKQILTLEAIIEVTEEQGRLAEADNFDDTAFDDTLTRKDVLIMRLNELDDGFPSVYDKVRKEVRANSSKYEESIAKMQDLIRKCTDIGMRIKTLEARNRDKLVNCFSGKKKEYSAKQAAATVANKYSVTMKNANDMNEGYRFNQDK